MASFRNHLPARIFWFALLSLGAALILSDAHDTRSYGKGLIGLSQFLLAILCFMEPLVLPSTANLFSRSRAIALGPMRLRLTLSLIGFLLLAVGVLIWILE